MKRKDIIDTEKLTPVENAQSFLKTLCTSFTTIMLVSLLIVTILGNSAARQEIMWCWSLFGSCVCAAVLQFVFFTPVVIKRMLYPLRLLAFGVCLYVVLAALAVAMSWFPTDKAGAWVSFTVIYLIMLAAATAMLTAERRLEERRLNEGLSEFRKNNGRDRMS